MRVYSLFKDDLSYKKDTSQSHTAAGTMYGAENAVDGKTATCTRTQEIGLNSPYNTVWWKVDLGGVYNIYSVNILFKNYDGHGMNHKMHLSGSGAIKARRSHFWSQSHFSSIYSFTESEIEIKSEIVSLLWPRSLISAFCDSYHAHRSS